MILKKLPLLLIAWCLPVAGPAQSSDAPVPLQIRAVLHDPVHPTADLFLTDKTGGVVKLKLVPEGFSEVQSALLVNGSLILYRSASVDPKNLMANLAASVKIPPSTKRAMLIILPAPAESKPVDGKPAESNPSYRIVLIDDSPKAFPKGESRVLPLITVEAAIEAGEHKLPIHPGVITNVPAVRKVNPYNMAQTNFYFKQGGAWVTFVERQLQFLDAYRRVFIVHVTPGATQPEVTTILDTAPAVINTAPPKH